MQAITRYFAWGCFGYFGWSDNHAGLALSFLMNGKSGAAARLRPEAAARSVCAFASLKLRAPVAASSAKTAGFGMPSFVPKWRARRDSNS